MVEIVSDVLKPFRPKRCHIGKTTSNKRQTTTTLAATAGINTEQGWLSK